MRKIRFVTICILLFFGRSLSQQNYTEKIKEIFSIGTDLILDKVNSENITQKISFDQATEYARKLNDVILNDPLGFKRYLSLEYKKWAEETKMNNYVSLNVKPAYKVYMVKQVILKYYGDLFADVISTPYFLKVKIIDFKTNIYTAKDIKISTKQTELLVEVEDILKGKKYINVGDSIRISYLNFWIGECEIKFQNGKSYLLPVKVTECTDNDNEDCIKYNLHIFSYVCRAIKEIENGLVTPEPILENSSSVEWQQFKTEFIKKYISPLEDKNENN